MFCKIQNTEEKEPKKSQSMNQRLSNLKTSKTSTICHIYIQDLNNADWSGFDYTTDINKAVDLFNRIVINAADKNAPFC